MRSTIKFVWDHTPTFLNPLFNNPINRGLCGLIFCGGVKYYSHYKWLLKSQWWPIEKMEEHRFLLLKKNLKHAYNTVSFYHTQWKKEGVKPEDIKSVEDIEKIPIITKDDVLKDYNNFFSMPIKKQNIKTTLTGGSTGKPLAVSYDNNYYGYRSATGRLMKKFAGFDDFSLRISIPGCGPFFKRTNDTFEYNPVTRQLFFSRTVLSDNILKQYVDIIQKFKPKYMDAHPSVAYYFAKYFSEEGITDVSFDSIFCSGEVLYDFQRKFIEKQFGGKVFNHYAQNEGFCYAVECEEHEGLHISEMGLVEIVDKNGRRIRPGKAGRIVGTTFYNNVWPLIRYDIGDIGIMEIKPCRCGRGFLRIKEIQGRHNDIIRLPNGAIILPNCFTTIMDKFSFAKQFQFVQEDEKNLVLKIVKKDKINEKEITSLKKHLKKLTNNTIDIRVEYVDTISLVGRKNKYRYVISNLYTV